MTHRTAYHEAAHALACLLCGVEFEQIVIGRDHQGQPAPPDSGWLHIPGEVAGDKALFIKAAGAAAEQLFFGQALISCRNDILGILAIFAQIGYDDQQAEAAAAKCIAEARKLLAPRAGLIRLIATELQQRQALSYEEVRQLL